MSRRAGLDRLTVVRTAETVADASFTGLQELSLAEVAQRLGVRTPSLYKHIDGLPALRRELRLIALLRLYDILADAAVGRSRDTAIRAIADAYRQFARQHPGLYAAALQAPEKDDAELKQAGERVVGVVVRVLEGYGPQGNDALHAVRALRSVLHGFVSLEAAGAFGLPLDLDTSYQRLVDLFIDGLASTAEAARTGRAASEKGGM
ncbi:MAG TPA: TetR-like C-terminal domain-containing protein [Chloroflexota bacterium]